MKIEYYVTRNLNIMYLDDYKRKMLEIFEDENKFHILSEDPLESNLTKFRKNLLNMKPYLSKKTFLQIQPNEGNKYVYGVIENQSNSFLVRLMH